MTAVKTVSGNIKVLCCSLVKSVMGPPPSLTFTRCIRGWYRCIEFNTICGKENRNVIKIEIRWNEKLHLEYYVEEKISSILSCHGPKWFSVNIFKITQVGAVMSMSVMIQKKISHPPLKKAKLCKTTNSY